ncbi:5'-methylthioadenosine/S-adenosylhomocysteine nucleosidase [Amycolatopsis sp. NPDC051128]|uniref:5'-methylthioadenosine/S-adenosylhomocysteine nucleosidase family protein n=1 Tax=Amycolatopsis sp. NPDC051128 TaxID=3155412 RepID=UPI0034492B6B
MSEPTIVVLTALEVEYAAVRTLLSEPRLTTHPAGTLFEVGRLPGGRGSIVLALTGPGNQAAAILTERAVSTFAPDALLFVGVAGALHDDLQPGDVVVATKVYSYHGGKDQDSGFLARPQAWEAPHALDQLARHVARRDSWTALLRSAPERRPHVHFKPIAAGEVVLNSRTTPLATQLRTTYNDAAAIEMESAGVAKAGHLNHSRPVLAIRGISDKADGHKHAADNAGWQPIAAAHAAAFALALAPEIPLANRPSSTRGEVETVIEALDLVVTALTAGAVAGAKDTASAAVKDAYASLKTATSKAVRRSHATADAGTVLEAPGDHRDVLASALTDATTGTALVDAARKVLALVDPHGTETGKYVLDVHDNKGVQVGDGNTMTLNFND